MHMDSFKFIYRYYVSLHVFKLLCKPIWMSCFGPSNLVYARDHLIYRADIYKTKDLQTRIKKPLPEPEDLHKRTEHLLRKKGLSSIVY